MLAEILVSLYHDDFLLNFLSTHWKCPMGTLSLLNTQWVRFPKVFTPMPPSDSSPASFFCNFNTFMPASRAPWLLDCGTSSHMIGTVGYSHRLPLFPCSKPIRDHHSVSKIKVREHSTFIHQDSMKSMWAC